MRATTHDQPSTADMTTLIDDCIRQVSRDVEEGASGPEAFNLLLRRLMTHFDRVDTEEGYTCLLYTSPSPRDQRGSRMPSSA